MLRKSIVYMALLLATTVQAESIPTMLKRELPKITAQNRQAVAVVFHTDQSSEKVLPIVASAMTIRDPEAFFYPYWVTEITFRGFDPKTKCGVVVGKWFSNSLADYSTTWQPRLHNRIDRLVNAKAIMFFTPGSSEAKIAGGDYSDASATTELCKIPDFV